MKKQLIGILVFLMVGSLCSCATNTIGSNSSGVLEEDVSVVSSSDESGATSNATTSAKPTKNTSAQSSSLTSTTTLKTDASSDKTAQMTKTTKTTKTTKMTKTTKTTLTPLTPQATTSTTLSHTHVFGEWKTVVEPDCRSMGERLRSCACGETERATLPKTAHRYSNNVCAVCGHTKANTFVSDTPAAQANTIGAERGDARVTAQGDWLYFANGRDIVKTKKDGSGRKTVYTVSAGVTCNINIVGDWIYFCVEGSKRDNSYIAKVRTDGAEFEKILNAVLVRDLLIIKDQMFFTTLVNPYTNYAKDCCPLYLVPTSGGLAKQVHDGYVSNLIADGTYIYFRYAPLDSGSSVCRMKHNAKSKVTLLSNKDVNYFVLQNSRLYYTAGGLDDGCSIVSIGINGGSVTTHGTVPYCDERITVLGKKLYFNGMPYRKGSVEPDDMLVGVHELNLSTKQQRFLLEDFDNRYGFAVKNRLFVEKGEDAYSVYDPSTQKWTEIRI